MVVGGFCDHLDVFIKIWVSVHHYTRVFGLVGLERHPDKAASNRFVTFTPGMSHVFKNVPNFQCSTDACFVIKTDIATHEPKNYEFCFLHICIDFLLKVVEEDCVNTALLFRPKDNNLSFVSISLKLVVVHPVINVNALPRACTESLSPGFNEMLMSLMRWILNYPF